MGRTSTSPTAVADRLRALIAADRLRQRYLPDAPIGNAEWRVVLVLALAFAERRKLRFKQVATAGGTPPTTGRCAIERLCRRRLAMTYPSRSDRRVIHVQMTAAGWRAITAWIETVGSPTRMAHFHALDRAAAQLRSATALLAEVAR